jgi:CubicO group peptidase (beta-lactamase class C family)
LRKGREEQVGNLDDFLKSTQTTAFIVIKDDEILYEKYFNGYARDSINTSFSMAKSFDSALIGIAIDEGLIKSVDEPITNYLPELKEKGFETITIKHLLTMASGIKYRENGLPWGDDALTYYFPDLRKLALGAKIKEPPGLHFQYNNYHPLLIGIILERATGSSVSHYMQEKIWKPLGMEYPATWSLDSEETGFEKMESGLNARSIDFAKFGRLFLNNGAWNGRQIISEKWVVESTSPMTVDSREYYHPKHDPSSAPRLAGNGFYTYFWWGYKREDANHDFYAAGKHGQYIYVCPHKNLILVRNGKKLGIDNWPRALREMADRI